MSIAKTVTFALSCLVLSFVPINHVSACPLSDLDGDCETDMIDLVILGEQWLNPVGCLGFANACADFVGNDGVNLQDFAILAQEWELKLNFPVVINEIHYNPDLPYELVEFVELYNAGNKEIDLSGWYFSKGISYTFPANTILSAGAYLVISENASVRIISPITSVSAKYGTSISLLLGPFTGSLDNEGEEIVLRDDNGMVVDQVDYKLGFPWPTVGDAVPDDGTNPGSGHSIQLANPAFDNNLAANWRSAYPTPGAANTAVYAENLPPLIRQVVHNPDLPTTTDIVTVSAKVTDSDGVSSVLLLYQVVTPGSYISIKDTIYNSWTSLAMHDDGINGDQFAQDSVYSVQLPAATRQHRYLIRYRILAQDNDGRSITVPYADDPQSNFAYFVYNGVPAWTGAIRPGVTAPVTYGAEVMNALPVYHLISKQTDVETATWYSKYTGEDYLWYGTMVYDGKVYDHIRYRARGGVWRYAMGKNMWKFDFNRGHYFQARDDYGKKYDTKWDKLNFSACIQQGDYQHRGEQGMFEAAGFKLFNLMGVEAPKTHWVQFRIIDQANENGSTQYNGDLWGLYLVLEQMDGYYLDEHDLPDGNLYKIENYAGSLNNQSAIQSINGSDYTTFRNAWYNVSKKPTESWWRQNVDLNRYYSYRCIVEGIHHGDIGYGKNYFFYHNPLTGIWAMYPWDLDLTWANNMYGNGEEPFKSTSYGAIFNHSAIKIEYQNRLREFHDLLYNTDQLHALLDELAAIIDAPDGNLSIVDVDRAMWDYNPIMINSSIVNTSKAGQGRFYQQAVTKDFPGMVQIMKNYVIGYRAFNTYSEDLAIPATPVITYIGQPGYPENDLQFQTTAFSDPQGPGTFAAIQWRIAEVQDYSSLIGRPTEPLKFEIEPVWESDELTTFANTVRIPADGIKPDHMYRVRCKMKDTSGRWSHWSAPVQFVAGTAINADILMYLRVTELMYNNGDADFIELKNTGPTVLDISGVSITSGVTFSFAKGNVTTLAPGDFVLVVKDTSSFRQQYGTGLDDKIAGNVADGNFSNSGEKIKIEDTWNGTIVEFEYSDGRGWPLAADGAGHSLIPQDDAIAGQRLGILDFGGNWRQSTYIDGSPGSDDPAPIAGLVINEVMAHTDYNNPAYPDHDSNDWIELYNASASNIYYDSNWYLSDDSDDLKKWSLPVGTLSAGSHVSFDEVTGFHNPVSTGFGLDKAGEQIFLSFLPGTTQDRVVDCIKFKGQENSISLSRYPDGQSFWFHASPPTRDTANKNPVEHLIISEIMYHSPAGEPNDYIELYNPTATQVELWTQTGAWAVEGGIDFVFPPSTTLSSESRFVLVGFDPVVDTVAFDAFKTTYGNSALTAGVNIFGPYCGALANSGERLALVKPQDSDDPADPTAISWIIVDECIYADCSPWPTEPDGTGEVLLRLNASDPAASGNDPANWDNAAPSPGL